MNLSRFFPPNVQIREPLSPVRDYEAYEYDGDEDSDDHFWLMALSSPVALALNRDAAEDNEWDIVWEGELARTSALEMWIILFGSELRQLERETWEVVARKWYQEPSSYEHSANHFWHLISSWTSPPTDCC